MDCELCKALKENIRVVMEDEYSFAIVILHPQAELHCLVLPKRHTTTITDLSKEEAVSINRMIDDLRKKIDGILDCSSIVYLNGRTGISQSHLHYHVFPLAHGMGVRTIMAKFFDIPIYPEISDDARKEMVRRLR